MDKLTSELETLLKENDISRSHVEYSVTFIDRIFLTAEWSDDVEARRTWDVCDQYVRICGLSNCIAWAMAALYIPEASDNIISNTISNCQIRKYASAVQPGTMYTEFLELTPMWI
jgi:hypothetical protein